MNLSSIPLKAIALFVSLLFVLISGCVKNPVTRRYEVTLMSAEEESRIGEEQDEAVRKLYGVHEDEALQKYVQEIGARLVESAHLRPLTYHFTVVDSAEINAFALPGGYVYLTRGILAQCNSEAELAGVIGHEIAHVTARHHAQQQVRGMGLQIGSLLTTLFLGEAGIYLQRYIDLLFVGVYQSFGRHQELQADELGQQYAFASGWDPRDSTDFLETLDRMEHGRDRTVFHGFFASHPETYERIQESITRGEVLVEDKESGAKKRKEYLHMLEGLPFGNRPELGEFEEGLYKNGKSGISVRFSENWENFSSEGTVVSRRPNESYFMQLITTEPEDKTYLDHLTAREDYYIKLREMAEKFEDQKRWRRDSEERMIIHNIPIFATTYEFQSYLGRFYAARAHFMIVDKSLFILMAFAPVNQKHLADYYFKQVFQSVRLLDDSEIAALQPRKLEIYEVRKGDSFESIAERFYGTTERARKIAEFNGYTSSLYPSPGDALKIIVRTTGEEEESKPEKKDPVRKKGGKKKKRGFKGLRVQGFK